MRTVFCLLTAHRFPSVLLGPYIMFVLTELPLLCSNACIVASGYAVHKTVLNATEIMNVAMGSHNSIALQAIINEQDAR